MVEINRRERVGKEEWRKERKRIDKEIRKMRENGGTYETVYEDKIYKGIWEAKGGPTIDDKKLCTKKRRRV